MTFLLGIVTFPPHIVTFLPRIVKFYTIEYRACGCTVTHEGNKCHVSIPCLDSITDFNDNGIPDISCVYNALKKTLLFAGYCKPILPSDKSDDQPASDRRGQQFLNMEQLMKERYTFAGSMHTKIHDNYYNLIERVPCNDLRWSFRLGNMGNSSYNIVCELNSSVTDEIYVVNTNQYITVDKATRRCSPLPEWWKESYHKCQDHNVEKLHIKPFRKPEQNLEPSLIHHIGLRDVDHYKHTSYIVYVSLCLDYARDILPEGQRLRVQQISNNYMKECKLGDTIHMYCWSHSSANSQDVIDGDQDVIDGCPKVTTEIYRFQIEKISPAAATSAAGLPDNVESPQPHNEQQQIKTASSEAIFQTEIEFRKF